MESSGAVCLLLSNERAPIGCSPSARIDQLDEILLWALDVVVQFGHRTRVGAARERPDGDRPVLGHLFAGVDYDLWEEWATVGSLGLIFSLAGP